jgi:general secretion pathway protein G
MRILGVDRSSLSSADRKSSDADRISKSQAGLTLVELLVVLAILALFAGLAAPQVLRYLGTARTETAKTQLSSIESAIELYYLDVGHYPPSEPGLKSLIEAPANTATWNGPYLKKSKSLFDPWGNPYLYRFPGKHGDFDVLSFGRDGQPGGDGEDQDVTSW